MPSRQGRSSRKFLFGGASRRSVTGTLCFATANGPEELKPFGREKHRVTLQEHVQDHTSRRDTVPDKRSRAVACEVQIRVGYPLVCSGLPNAKYSAVASVGRDFSLGRSDSELVPSAEFAVSIFGRRLVLSRPPTSTSY